jgi:hypothetical protein
MQRHLTFLIKSVNGDELAAAQLMDDRRRITGKRGGRSRGIAQPRDFLANFRGRQGVVVEAGHLDEVDRTRAVGEDVLGDFGLDPAAPLPAAPFAGEIIRGDESQKDPRLRNPVVESVLPVVPLPDLLRVEKRR